jgi:hypothetical protein
MGRNIGPKGHWFTASEEEALLPGRKFDAAFDDEMSGEAELAPGWWRLPFALGGLIECYFAAQWIFAHL